MVPSDVTWHQPKQTNYGAEWRHAARKWTPQFPDKCTLLHDFDQMHGLSTYFFNYRCLWFFLQDFYHEWIGGQKFGLFFCGQVMKSTKVIRFNLKPKKSKPHENRNKTFSRDRIKTGQKKWKLNRSVKRLQVLNRIKNNPPRTNFGIFSFRGLRWKKSLTNFFHQPSLEARTFWVRP